MFSYCQNKWKIQQEELLSPAKTLRYHLEPIAGRREYLQGRKFANTRRYALKVQLVVIDEETPQVG